MDRFKIEAGIPFRRKSRSLPPPAEKLVIELISRSFASNSRIRNSRVQRKISLATLRGTVFSLVESPREPPIYIPVRKSDLKFSPESSRHAATQSGGIPEIPAYLARSFDRYLTCPYLVCWNSSSHLSSWSSFTFRRCRWFAQLKPRLRSEPNGNSNGVIKQL